MTIFGLMYWILNKNTFQQKGSNLQQQLNQFASAKSKRTTSLLLVSTYFTGRYSCNFTNIYHSKLLSNAWKVVLMSLGSV